MIGEVDVRDCHDKQKDSPSLFSIIVPFTFVGVL
jgi:hypothetical protein